MLIFGYVICCIATLATIPIFCSLCYLFFITLASLIPRKIRIKPTFNTKIAILISSHNEEKNIEKTVAKLISDIDYPPALYEVIVIANNCTDSTSYLASFAGAKTLEYTNEWKQGKWHAIEWSLKQLKKDKFDLFIILNVGSSLKKNSLQYLDSEFVEGHIVMQLPIEYNNDITTWTNSLQNGLSAPAQYLQPKGRDRIGFSAPLIGNGTILTKHILKKIPFDIAGNGGISEYFLRLITIGEKARFVCGKKVGVISNRKTQITEMNIEQKYILNLLKETFKGNCTAFESFFNIFVPSIQMIFLSLFVLLFTSGMLCLGADLPGCEVLVRYGLVMGVFAFVGIAILHLYIILGMLEKNVSIKTWIATLLWPIITITHFLIGNEKGN